MKGFLKYRFKLMRYADHPLDPNRMTGKSTGYALNLIGTAMMNPWTPYFYAESSNEKENRHGFNQMASLIERLSLEGFTLNRAKLTIKYDYHYKESL